MGLDNIGVFDRSKPLPIPTGGTLQQADGTAWMGFYCLTMTAMAMELMHDGNRLRVAYGDMASKFFEHFIQICDAMNMLSTSGLWDDKDGFYYDPMQVDGEEPIRMKIRSMVGLLPLIAVTALEKETIDRLPEFKRRFQWFMANRTEPAQHISRAESFHPLGHLHWLPVIPSRAKLIRVLGYMLDEEEFLSPCGIRSLSRYHADHPLVFDAGGRQIRVGYAPAESDTNLFGGNSNRRGPIWFPVNYLIIEALERYHHHYGDDLKVEMPTGSGNWCNLQQVADELSLRLTRLFLPDGEGRRPSFGNAPPYPKDPEFRGMVLFHEYVDGDTGKGLGAEHQMEWTALVVRYFGECKEFAHKSTKR